MIVGITGVTVLVCLTIFLVIVEPVLAAMLYVVLAAWIAWRIGRHHGFRRGVWQFFKDMIFGW
jgi:hypothetical protein